MVQFADIENQLYDLSCKGNPENVNLRKCNIPNCFIISILSLFAARYYVEAMSGGKYPSLQYNYSSAFFMLFLVLKNVHKPWIFCTIGRLSFSENSNGNAT